MLDLDGSIVESMIADGRRIVMDAISEYRPIAVVAAFSGGDDSIVTSHFAATEFSADILHCNTGIGLQATRDHVRSVCKRFNFELTEEFAVPEGRTSTTTDDQLPPDGWMDGATAYEEFALNFGFAGPGQHHRMYQRLKERSFRRYIRRLKAGTPRGTKVMIISGIRGDESSRRAGYNRAVQRNGAEIWVNPFYFRTASDFEAYRQEFGLPRNPVKARIGISGECLCGSFSNSDRVMSREREAIRSVDPAFSAYLDGLEARVRERGFPWGWGCRSPRWWLEKRRGQGFLFDSHQSTFMPMCVGCAMGRR